MDKSLWLHDYQLKEFPSLLDDLEVDVLVIGGGITGITCAYLLRDEGLRVALIEQKQLMHGTTGFTTGKLTIQHGLIYDELLKKQGIEKTKLYIDSHLDAYQLMKNIIQELSIDCDYEERTSYLYTQSPDELPKLTKEVEAYQKLNIPHIQNPILNLPFTVEGVIGITNQAHFHVVKYLQALVNELEKYGDFYIYENTKVLQVKEEDDVCVTFLENGRKVRSKYVILASHYPVNDTLNSYFMKLKPSMAYVVASFYDKEFTEGDYINSEEPTRSIRTHPYEGKRILIIAGETHQCGHSSNDKKHYQNLTDFGRINFNMESPLFMWSTQDYETFDKIPYIGSVNKSNPKILVTTGFKKWGMLTSTLSAMLCRDIILNKQNNYLDLYSPCRLSDKLTGKFFAYNLSGVARLIGDRFKNYDKSLAIESGKGKIISYRGKKYGIYKDEQGETFIVEAICPHLKCILTFNNEHKTYDCPCHGSRFNYKGEYLDGPAITNLKRIKLVKK
ncbi:MAG: FAD-dependent oxidoreductase [Bacilli bacterium]|nr:FAD-dependent oxidoreductase [Bacilli bacterium]